MVQPRPAHYAFAHRVLAETAHQQPWTLFDALRGPQAAPTLAAAWTRAGGTPSETVGLGVVAARPVGAWHGLAIALPTPIAAGEAHWILLALSAAGQLRYFVVERAVGDRGAALAEWRADGRRVRLVDLPSVSLEAVWQGVAEELLVDVPRPAPGVQVLAPSVAPTAMPARTAAAGKPPRIGLWVTLGAIAFAATAVGSFVGYQRWRAAQWRERQAARDAAAAEAKADYEEVRERVEERRAEIAEPRARCLAAERRRAETVLEKARANQVFALANKRPSDATALAGALAYRLPTEQHPARAAFVDDGGAWIPVSEWIARTPTACPAPGKAYQAIEVALAKPQPSHWAWDYAAQLEQRRDELERLEKQLEAPRPFDSPAQSLVVADNSCTSQAVATFNNYATGGAERLELKRYSCKAMLVWLSLEDGKPLAALRAEGRAAPERDPGMSTTTRELRRLNDDCYARARRQASELLRRQLQGWGGAAN